MEISREQVAPGVHRLGARDFATAVVRGSWADEWDGGGPPR